MRAFGGGAEGIELADPIAYTLARVATAYSQRFGDVAEWPYAEVLAASLALDELDRVESLRKDGEMLEQALRTAVAHHKPTELARTRADIRGRQRLMPVDGGTLPQDQDTLAALAKTHRIARRVARARRKGPHGGTV
jgi:hypothetical protein